MISTFAGLRSVEFAANIYAVHTKYMSHLLGATTLLDIFDIKDSGLTMEDPEVESVKFCRDWALRLENLGENPSLEMSTFPGTLSC
jgi:hypothetical protein